jgi:hypothetical protein
MKMRKLILSILTASSFFLTGCLETVQEITLNEDGSGTYVNTNDMGKVLTVAKNMGGTSSDKMPQQAVDTSFSFDSMTEIMTNLSAEEKELLKKGTIHIRMNVEEEQFLTKMTFPFSSLNDIQKFNKLSGMMMMESLKGQMPTEMPMGEEGLPETSSFDDYYTLEFSNGELKKKLNKEKYTNAESDEYLNGLKQAGAMGLPVISTIIINLPRPAEKAEGKNVKLSEDKKKVTITSTMDDFYDNPESLEFKIKY